MSVKKFTPRIRSILRMDIPELSAEHLALSQRVDYESMTDDQLQVHENSVNARRKIERQIEGAYDAMGATLIGAGILLENATIANYVSKSSGQLKAVALAEKYANNADIAFEKGIGLIFYGTIGTGKDHLMMGVAKRLFNAMKTVAWTNGPKLKTRMRNCIKGDDSEEALNRDCLAPDFLWISDLVVAGNSLSPFQSDCVYQIVEARYASGKPTLITINVDSANEFNSLLGAATADRLRANALTHFCDWESFRKPSTQDVFDKAKSLHAKVLPNDLDSFEHDDDRNRELFPPIARFQSKRDRDVAARLASLPILQDDPV